MTLLTRASVRYLAHHRGQVALSVLGVALGVAVVLSIDLAIQSARTAFRVSVETISGRATHQVTGVGGTLDERLFLGIRQLTGGPAAAPVVEGYASSERLPGRALRVVGIDPFSEGPFRPFSAAEGSGLDVSSFLATAGAAVLPGPLAEAAGVTAGDALSVTAGGRTASLTVVGALTATDGVSADGLSDVLLVDISTAQDLLGMSGFLTRIDLRAPGGPGGEVALDLVRDVLPSGVELAPAGARAASMGAMISAFDLNLTALSLLALVFGMFLIYNAVTFSVVQRRPILGRLRALGVTRREVMTGVLAEAASIGVAGAVVGVALGIWLATGLVRLVTRTINDLYFAVSVEEIFIGPGAIAKAVALGVGATLLAAAPPAWEAARSSPRLATLRSVREARTRAAIPAAALIGSGSVLLGVLLITLSDRSVLVGFVGLFLTVAGLAMATPAATVALVGLARPVLRRGVGTLGSMASRGVITALSRTAPAIAALVVAVSVTVGLGVMIESFRGTLIRWLDSTLVADVYVSLPGPGSSAPTGTLPPELIEALGAHPAVSGYSTYRGVPMIREHGPVRAVALDLDPRGEAAFDFLEGDPDTAMRGLREGRGVIVSEPYAFRYQVGVGDSVAISAVGRAERLPVLGVFYDYGADRGTLMMGRSLYDRLYDDPGVTSVALFLSADREATGVLDELRGLVPAGWTVTMRSNAALRSASLEVFDRTFEVTAVLRLLAFIVAFVGVLSALMALELERSRELGLMRATGMTPGQVGGLIVTQTGLMGLIAGVLAVPMGIALSLVMIFVINKRSFGWTLDLQLGPDVVWQAIAVAVSSAVLAGLLPAWRMARISPAAALRGE